MRGDAGGETRIAGKTALSGHRQHEPSKLSSNASTFLWCSTDFYFSGQRKPTWGSENGARTRMAGLVFRELIAR